MKVWFKKCWHRIVSLFCAAVIAFTTIAYSYPVLAVAGSVAAGAGSILAVLGVIGSIKEFCENCQWVWEIVEPIINKIKSSNASAIAEQQEYYRCYWKEIVSKGQLTESKFREYWTFVVTNGDDTSMESQYPGFTDTYSMLIETVASGLSLDSLCESIFSNSSDYSVDEKNNPVVSGSAYKRDVVDYWSEYYKPHPNSSQYIYSYQSNESDVGKNNLYFFNPTPPVYVNNDWGKKQYWTGGVYVLPFYQDDDLSEGTLYPDRYVYFHTSGTSKEGNLNICLDIYNLSDNKLISSFSAPWDIVKCPYVSWELLNLRFYRVILYPTYLDYMSGSNKKYLRPDITTDYGYFYGGKYVKYKLIDSLLQSTTFTPDTNKNDDWGYIMSNEPFQLFANQAQIDYDKIPDNYTITINGDTIYDYDITNPDTGDHGTVNYYITNNYTLPENGSKDDTKDDSGSGTVSGNVTVGGKVDVSGKIEIDTKPIDININVNGGGSGSSGSGDVSSSPEGVEFDQDVSLNNYYGWMQEQTTGFSGFMKNFFSWLPDPIVIMLCAGFALVILARFLGR